MSPQKGRQAARVVERVVHPGEEDVLHEKLAACDREVLPGGLEDLREWVAVTFGDKQRPGRVVGGVQRDREVHLRLCAASRSIPLGMPTVDTESAR